MTTLLSTLIARVEAWDGVTPDREMDAYIDVAFGLSVHFDPVTARGCTCAARYTASLDAVDAATRRLFPEAICEVICARSIQQIIVILWHDLYSYDTLSAEVCAPTELKARLLALLYAVREKEGKDGI